MITWAQLLAHVIGDFFIQSDWMATHKTKEWSTAFVHASVYTLPFLVLTQSPIALLTILISHAIIDRFSLAKYIIILKNQLAPASKRPPAKVSELDTFGFPEGTPMWIQFPIYVITDNTMHIVINGFAITYL